MINKLLIIIPPVACVPEEEGLVLIDDDVAMSGALVLIELDVEGNRFRLSLPSAIPSPSTTPSIATSVASLPLALVLPRRLHNIYIHLKQLFNIINKNIDLFYFDYKYLLLAQDPVVGLPRFLRSGKDARKVFSSLFLL